MDIFGELDMGTAACSSKCTVVAKMQLYGYIQPDNAATVIDIWQLQLAEEGKVRKKERRGKLGRKEGRKYNISNNN